MKFSLAIIFTVLFSLASNAQENKEFVVPEDLLKQVESGNDEIAYFVALQFLEGNDSFAPNYDKGVEWLKKAAELGNPHAMYDLSEELIYQEKETEALDWLLKSSEKGHAASFESLGMLHYNGQAGLEKDCNKAYSFFEQAQLRSHELAFNNHAWFLATSPDKNCRNPEKALKIIYELMAIYAGEMIPWFVLDTKAAVLAAVSDFTQAIELQELIVKEASGDGDSMNSYKERLESYKQRKPWISKN